MSLRRLIHLAACALVVVLSVLCGISGAQGQDSALTAVQQKLDFAKGLYREGEFKLARKAYRQILALDSGNREAAVGLKLIERAQEPSWTREKANAADAPNAANTEIRSAVAATQDRLRQTVLAEVSFKATPLKTALDFVQREYDRMDKQSGQGSHEIFISLKLPAPQVIRVDRVKVAEIPGLPVETISASGPVSAPMVWNAAETKITLEMNNVSLLEVLQHITAQARSILKFGPDQVWLLPRGSYDVEFVTTEWKVEPAEIGLTGNDFPAPASEVGGKDISRDVIGLSVVTVNHRDIAKFLTDRGVYFPPGASATYLPSTHKLIERNRPEELEKTRDILDQGRVSSPAPDDTSKPTLNP